MEIAYRRPEQNEAEAFAALHVQCWRESYADFLPPELMASFTTAKRLPMWQARLADGKLFVMGAYVSGVPAGFVMSGVADQNHIADQDGHLWALYVAAAHHRKGIGRRLAAMAAADWLAQNGTTMTIGVLAQNKLARSFYEALGAEFVRSGTYAWDGHPLPDCLYIWRDLAKIAKV